MGWQMFIDLCGMGFHLDVARDANTALLRAAIVDEAFMSPPLREELRDEKALFRMIEAYSGVRPSAHVRMQIIRYLANSARPASLVA